MTTYEVLTSKLRVRPTFTSAEEVIRKDFSLKLPSRRYIHLWNTPEISQFRGYQDLLDETEERKHVAAVTRLDIQQTARQTNQPSMDAEIVQEMLQNQRQSSAAMAQHMRDLAEHTRRENAGMAAEQREALQQLANSHAHAQNLQRISETALTSMMRDSALEQRNLIQDLAAKAGHVTNNIDSRHFETHNHAHNNTTQMTDVNVHNQAMQLMQSHTQQLGIIMQQNQIGHEQMQQGLYNTILQQQKAASNPQVILHMLPQAPPMAIMPFQPPPGPPPPPGAGAIAIPVVPRPAPLLKPEFIVKAPVPTPAPTIQPERIIRNQTDEIIRKQQRELDSYSRAQKNNKPNRVAPWNSGVVNPPTMPPPKAAPKAAPPIAAPAVLPEAPATAPGAPVVVPTVAPPAPLPAAPVVRGRAPRSLASASTRAPSTRAPSARTRDRSRSVETTAPPPPLPSSPDPPGNPPGNPLTPANLAILDKQTGSKPKAKAKGKKKVNLDGGIEIITIPKPKRAPRRKIDSTTLASKRRTTLQGVTTVSGGVTSKIRVIPLKAASGVSPKRRGRPPGSLGKKKRDVAVAVQA